MSDMQKRIEDIEHWAVVNHQGVHPSVTLPKADFDWLIEQTKKVEKQQKEIETLKECVNNAANDVLQQADKIERYENIIHAIANIDTLFYLLDGTEREWNDEEALKEIENLVKPVWDEHCIESNKKMRKKFDYVELKRN